MLTIGAQPFPEACRKRFLVNHKVLRLIRYRQIASSWNEVYDVIHDMLTVISGKLNTAFRVLLLCLPGQQTALQICASPTCTNTTKNRSSCIYFAQRGGHRQSAARGSRQDQHLLFSTWHQQLKFIFHPCQNLLDSVY